MVGDWNGQSQWCPGPELNRYVSFETRDFKSRASANFATRAGREVIENQLIIAEFGGVDGLAAASARAFALAILKFHHCIPEIRLIDNVVPSKH